jgi:hypothetical protein
MGLDANGDWSPMDESEFDLQAEENDREEMFLHHCRQCPQCRGCIAPCRCLDCETNGQVESHDIGEVCLCVPCTRCLELAFECTCETAAARLITQDEPSEAMPLEKNRDSGERSGHYWTAQETLLLKREFRSGSTLHELASLLSRTEMAVTYRLVRLGLVQSVDLDHALRRAQMRYLDIDHRVKFKKNETEE